MAEILVAAGGTGGHVYPALALAEVLRDRGHNVAFAGGDRIETRLVPEAGFTLHSLPARGLPRSVSPAAVASGVAFLRSLRGARRLLRSLGTDVVVGMGGYPSLAPSLAAGWMRRPVVLHEQNAVLSLAHRLSVRRARVLALSLPLEAGEPSRAGLQVEVVGNPLRETVRAFAALDPDRRAGRRAAALEAFGLDQGPVTVLGFGGSLGARPLNEALPQAASAWDEGVQVLHIAGPDHADAVRRSWEGKRCRCVVVPYVDRMEDAYAIADVVVSRSGASTVAELTAIGLPAVVVPLPFAPGGAQAANGRILEHAGAGRVVEQGDDLLGRLRDALDPLLVDRDLRERMATVARGLGKPDATERLADLVCAQLA